jgi:hypothetical protein
MRIPVESFSRFPLRRFWVSERARWALRDWVLVPMLMGMTLLLENVSRNSGPTGLGVRL